jgi:hypothetical protein
MKFEGPCKVQWPLGDAIKETGKQTRSGHVSRRVGAHFSG